MVFSNWIPDDPRWRLEKEFAACTVIELLVTPSNVADVGVSMAEYFDPAEYVEARVPSPFLTDILKVYCVLADNPLFAHVLVLIQPLLDIMGLVVSKYIPDSPLPRFTGALPVCIVIEEVVKPSQVAEETAEIRVYFGKTSEVRAKTPSAFRVVIVKL